MKLHATAATIPSRGTSRPIAGTAPSMKRRLPAKPASVAARWAALATCALLTGVTSSEAQVPLAPQVVRVYAGTATAPAATVSVSPSSVAIAPGGKAQFTAQVTGTFNTAVSWSATGGTITSSGLFTAGTATGTYAVKATISGGTYSGSAAVSITSGAGYIDVAPGSSIQNQINNQPDGSRFRLKAGVHRITSALTPKVGNVFVGEAGAILSGARLLTAFTRSGNAWVVGGQTQQGQVHGSCIAGYPRCSYPEDLYIDDVMVRHVAVLSDVGPGKWFFDYGNDAIYVGDDPTGRRVETTLAPYAFGGTAAGVTISGLVIEKFANRAQLGAISGDSVWDWKVEANEVRFNHGVGIRIGQRMVVSGNNVHHNGQMGIGGVGDGVLVDGNTIAYNNTAGFDFGWEGGGTKFVKTNNLVVRNNYSHHNVGPGLWLDIDNINFTIENNRSEDNDGTITAAAGGLFVEISYGGVVRNNIVRRNGRTFSAWGWGAGILVAASGGSGLEIYGNTVEDNGDGIALIQQSRGSGMYGAYVVQNVWVHDNQIRMTTGTTGAVQDIGDNSIFTSRNNRFTNNSYAIGADARYWDWMNAMRTESEWKAYGNDTSGTFVR